MAEEAFCRQIAREAGEQIAGTALEGVTTWLLLEYSGAWGAKALAQSRLPKAVRQRLMDLQEEVPGCRVHFIRQARQVPASGKEAELLLFKASERDPAGWRLTLPSYRALLEIDLQACAQGDKPAGAFEVPGPVFLVCTNGKRDRCCAKWGRPAYGQLERLAGSSVWQTTHTGGHRFAPNVICLPHGVMYGWVDLEEVPQLESSYRQRRLHRLDRFRGLVRYPRPAQAAEVFLRRSMGVLDLERYELLSCHEVESKLWQVSFRDSTETTQHDLLIRVVTAPEAIPLSCEAEPKTLTRFELQQHRTEQLRGM